MKTKTLKIIFWISTILFGAMTLMSGVTSLLGSEAGEQLMTELGYPLYFNYILGVAKVLGAIALFVPQFRVLKEWAYAGFTFDIIGASASFAFTGATFGQVLFPLIFLAVMFVSYASWKKTRKAA